MSSKIVTNYSHDRLNPGEVLLRLVEEMRRVTLDKTLCRALRLRRKTVVRLAHLLALMEKIYLVANKSGGLELVSSQEYTRWIVNRWLAGQWNTVCLEIPESTTLARPDAGHEKSTSRSVAAAKSSATEWKILPDRQREPYQPAEEVPAEVSK